MVPEVKLHNVKGTIIGSSWLSPLKEIEIQLTFNGIVMEFQLSVVWLCASYLMNGPEAKKEKVPTAGEIMQLFWDRLEGEWTIPNIWQIWK